MKEVEVLPPSSEHRLFEVRLRSRGLAGLAGLAMWDASRLLSRLGPLWAKKLAHFRAPGGVADRAPAARGEASVPAAAAVGGAVPWPKKPIGCRPGVSRYCTSAPCATRPPSSGTASSLSSPQHALACTKPYAPRWGAAEPLKLAPELLKLLPSSSFGCGGDESGAGRAGMNDIEFGLWCSLLSLGSSWRVCSPASWAVDSLISTIRTTS